MRSLKIHRTQESRIAHPGNTVASGLHRKLDLQGIAMSQQGVHRRWEQTWYLQQVIANRALLWLLWLLCSYP